MRNDINTRCNHSHADSQRTSPQACIPSDHSFPPLSSPCSSAQSVTFARQSSGSRPLLVVLVRADSFASKTTCIRTVYTHRSSVTQTNEKQEGCNLQPFFRSHSWRCGMQQRPTEQTQSHELATNLQRFVSPPLCVFFEGVLWLTWPRSDELKAADTQRKVMQC